MTLKHGEPEWSREPTGTEEPSQQRDQGVLWKIIKSASFLGTRSEPAGFGSQEATEVWLNPHLSELSETANLDDQEPATLYFLGQVKDIEHVQQVYVEQKENGQKKHWVVLSERNYDSMDEIYDVEEDTIDRFPAADLDFRVTVQKGGGPSVQDHAIKIFDVR